MPRARAIQREIDVDAHLAGLGEEFDAYRFAGYSYFSSEWMTPAINWKFGIDTFLEAYHLPALHRATVAPLIRGNLGAFDAYGDHGRMTFVRFSSSAWDGKPDAEWEVLPHIIAVYRLMPNTVLVFQSDHLETWRMIPGETPDRSRIEFAFYTPQPAGHRQGARLLEEELRSRDQDGARRGFRARRTHAAQFHERACRTR
jgi:hypothetical protein